MEASFFYLVLCAFLLNYFHKNIKLPLVEKVVVGIISRRNQSGETEYLLASSVKESFGKYSGAYYPPGGHLEYGETEEDALIREFKEELDLDVQPAQRICETAGDVPDQITYWWICRIIGGDMRRNTAELSDAGYFTTEQMQELVLWPATRNFFDEHSETELKV